MTAVPPLLARRARNLAADLCAAEVFAALNSEGIEAILLKGPSLARWLYDEGEIRPYADVDFLVAPGSVVPTENVLRRLGYEWFRIDTIKGDRPKHARIWVRPRDKATIDLHRHIAGVGVSDDQVWEALSSSTDTFDLRGIQVTCLSAPGLAFHVAMHASQHGRESRKCLDDLSRAIERASLEEWRRAVDIARDLGALPHFVAGLGYDPRGEGLLEELALEAEPSMGVVLREQGTRDLVLGFDWLVRLPWHKKIVWILRKTFPPPDFLRAWMELKLDRPRSLFVGYLIRPFWLLRRAPAAFRIFRDARRSTRSR